MRVVVTGATGNVGTSVLDALISDGNIHSISGIARRLPALSRPKTHFTRLDVARDELRYLFEGADVVVHLAWRIQPARDVHELRRTNVEGSRQVFEAVASSGVRKLVYASSVGAYSPRKDDRAIHESYPTDGIATSVYSRQKAEVEKMLDEFELAHPRVHVVRIRPCLIFKRSAGSEIKRYFLGPLVPRFLLGRRLLISPFVDALRFQVVHSSDVAEAYRLAVTMPVRGAFNIAADPVIDSAVLAEALGARPVRIPEKLLRAGLWATWRAHLHRTDPGWLDLALKAPVLSPRRAHDELGWRPHYTSLEALQQLIEGMRRGSGLATPPLAPSRANILRPARD